MALLKLRNLLTKPPVKAKLYKHQKEGYQKALQQDAFALLFDMGLGKSLVALAVMGQRFNLGQIRRVLIVCPSCVCPVWQREFEQFADFAYTLHILEGPRDKRLRVLEQEVEEEAEGLQVVVINYEGVWRLEEALYNFAPDMVICDESQRIKTPTSKQSKCLHRLGDLVKYKMILTGTPVQNSPLDFYSQYRFLDPEVLGRSFVAFRNRYSLLGGYQNHQVVGYQNMEELVQKVHAHGMRVRKEDALDLPKQIFINRYVKMSAYQAKVYESIRTQAICSLQIQQEEEGIELSSVLTKLLRLQQLAGGYLCHEQEARMEAISYSKMKLLETLVQEQLKEENKKIVIFARFTHEIHAIYERLDHLAIRSSILYGQTKDKGEIVRQFQEEPEVKVLIAQIQTAGVGITLTAADTAIYYSVGYSYADYAQSLARIHRIGQTNPCTYIHLITQDTIDETIYQALEHKQDLAKMLVDNWKSVIKNKK